MGQEIACLSFSDEDFAEFKARLQQETDLLERWLAGAPGLDPICRPFAQGSLVGGFELEAWLVTPQGDPAPINSAYLEAVNNPLVVPELAPTAGHRFWSARLCGSCSKSCKMGPPGSGATSPAW
jgi:hypothetical protein